MIKDIFQTAMVGGLGVIFLAGCFGIKGELFAEPGDRDPPTLRYDGYYYSTDVEHRIVGSSILTIVLWEDGTAAHPPVIGRRLGSPSELPIRYGALDEAHEEAQNWIRNLTGRSGDGGTNWGNFLIEGNRIRTRVLIPIGHMNPFHPAGILEYEGVVLSDTSFVITSRIFPTGPDRHTQQNMTFFFQPFDEVPSSRNWTHRYWRDPSEH